MIKKAINLLILFSLIFQTSISEAVKLADLGLCRKALEQFSDQEWVGLGLGPEKVRGLFACGHCGSVVLAHERPNKGIECEGCGSPFDGDELTLPSPQRELSDGTISVPKSLLLTGDDLNFFSSKPDWVCGCNTRNSSNYGDCSKCGSPQENKVRTIDPKVEDANAEEVLKHIAAKDEAANALAHPKNSPLILSELSRAARDNGGTNAIPAAAVVQDIRGLPMARTFKVIIAGASMVAALASGLGWWSYSETHPKPIVGEILEKNIQVVVFRDQNEFAKYSNTILDLANPPDGVKVFTSTPKNLINFANLPSGYVAQKYHFVIGVASAKVTVDVDSTQFARFNPGDKVSFEVRGAQDYKLK